jgi:hypothetical protein
MSVSIMNYLKANPAKITSVDDTVFSFGVSTTSGAEEIDVTYTLPTDGVLRFAWKPITETPHGPVEFPNGVTAPSHKFTIRRVLVNGKTTIVTKVRLIAGDLSGIFSRDCDVTISCTDGIDLRTSCSLRT